jgi:hypothetical protein
MVQRPCRIVRGGHSMSYRRKRRAPFVTLPRHKRGNAVVRLKGKMRRDAGVYGGRFASRLVLDEPGRPDLYNQWFDFYFPGTNRFTLWNAALVTARKAFWDAASDMAFARAHGALTPQEMEYEAKLEFEPAQRSRTGKILGYKLVDREPVRYAQFGGLTFSEQVEKLEAEIVRDEPPVIHESFALDRDYVYGIGLHIVLDAATIDRTAIEYAIDRFLAVGETDWRAAEPVPRERLPLVTEREALRAVDYPSVLLGKPVRGG